MDELSEMVTAIEECRRESILATVVDVDGSSYRQPGARMLMLAADDVDDHGDRRIGMISGGCLERELCQMAPAMTQTGPRLIAIDTRANQIYPHGRFGAGCHGLLHILLERITGPQHRAAIQMKTVLELQKPMGVGIVCRSDGEMPPVGTRLDEASIENAEEFSEHHLGPLFRCIRASLSECRTGQTSVMKHFATGDSSCDVFFYRLLPAPPIWIFGAGEDALPLIQMCDSLGLRATLFDSRMQLLVPDRVGSRASRIGLPTTEVVSKFRPCEETSIVIMTHNLSQDAMLLPWALRSCASYVGILGPKRRTARVLQICRERGVDLGLLKLENLRTPIGLDLGASNSAEIALSILAEIVATRNARNGTPLRRRTAPIHDAMRHEIIALEREFEAELSSLSAELS